MLDVISLSFYLPQIHNSTLIPPVSLTLLLPPLIAPPPITPDPEALLKQGLFPTPDHEVEFWNNKADNLNTIFQQLQSDGIRRILRVLDQHKSTYCNPFAKLCTEVFTARQEANDNIKFLRTLETWFDKINDDTQDFEQVRKTEYRDRM